MDKIYLTQKDFDNLLEYSTSIPTGTTTGKQWKRHIFRFDIKGREHFAGYLPDGIVDYADDWWMGEYQAPIDMQVPIKWRKIIVKNSEIPDRTNPFNL